MNNHETAGDKLAPAKRKNLPNRILRAVDNAMHLSGLQRNVKATLAEICRYVSQAEPLQTIFPTKAKIAERTGASERTIYRHLEKLVELQLIELSEQERKSRNGRFAVARIRLTRKAAVLLGFIEDPNYFFHSEPSDKVTAGHTLTDPTISKNQPVQRFKNGLPEDLAVLMSRGMTRPAVFRLMKMATNRNKWLSDIVAVASHKVAELTGGCLSGYLAKLIEGPTDFAYQARLLREQKVAQIEEQKLALKISAFRQRFAGTTLTNRAQSTLYVIDQTASFLQVISKRFSGSKPLAGGYAEIIDALETGTMVLATADAERRIYAGS